MSQRRGIILKLAVLTLAVLAMSVVDLRSSVAPAEAANPSTFASVNAPIGVAATPQKLLVSRPFSGTPREILSIDSTGATSVFATLPATGSLEQYLAISPGLGGFPANYVYVTQAQTIHQITPDGSTISTFATIPSLASSVNVGITFDHIGSFGFDMLVTGTNGQVWRVNSSGSATLVGTVPAWIEGPDVAPLSFAPYGGHVLVAAEQVSTVYAVSPTGTVSTVASWPNPDGVAFVPSNVCTFGTSGGAFFTAIYPTHITKFPASDFTGLAGRALVMSEFGGGIGLLTSDGTSVTVSTFQTSIGEHEGSSFVRGDCAAPTPDRDGYPLSTGGWCCDPTNVVVGNFFHQQRDLIIPGRGVPLAMERSYSSLETADLGLGIGQVHSFGMKVVPETGAATVRMEDGRPDRYTESGGVYTPPTGIHNTLVKNGDNTWTLTKTNKLVYNFDTAGPDGKRRYTEFSGPYTGMPQVLRPDADLGEERV